MARNVQLGDVIDRTLKEARHTTNSSSGADFRQHVKELIITTQEFYYDEFNWPFMKTTKANSRKTLAAGQRYYDFPSLLSQEHSFRCWYKHHDVWIELDQGIGPAEYSAFDSDDDERSEPALKWDFHDETQFEIWPIPSSNDKEVWFEGKKALTSLVNETDRLDLDDRMIILSVAADISEASNSKLAARLRSMAERRYWQQRARSSKDIPTRVGLSEKPSTSPPNSSGWPRTIAVYNERD